MTTTEVTPQTRTLSELPRLIERAEGFPAVLAALSSGHSATIGGTWGSSCALVAATLARGVPKTLFVITPHVSDVDDLCDDITTFLGERASTRSKGEEPRGSDFKKSGMASLLE